MGSALEGNVLLSLDALGVMLAVSPFGPEAKVGGAIALGITSTIVGATDADSATAKGRLATLGAFANIFGIQTAPLEFDLPLTCSRKSLPPEAGVSLGL